MHALIIETDAFIGCMIEDALRESGFTSFDFACSVEEAISAASARCPDLITTDVRVGIGTGLDAVAQICSGKRIPIVFITATAGDLRAWHEEPTVVRKPFSVADVVKAVAQMTTAKGPQIPS